MHVTVKTGLAQVPRAVAEAPQDRVRPSHLTVSSTADAHSLPLPAPFPAQVIIVAMRIAHRVLLSRRACCLSRGCRRELRYLVCVCIPSYFYRCILAMVQMQTGVCRSCLAPHEIAPTGSCGGTLHEK